MPLPKKMEFEGKDIAEAISKACKTLNVSQEKLDIKVLKTGTSGIFGLCRQKARLQVALKKEFSDAGGAGEEKVQKKPAAAKSEKPKPPEKKKQEAAGEKKSAPPAKTVEKPRNKVPKNEEAQVVVSDDLQADVKSSLARILELMDFPSEISVGSDRENVIARINGDYVETIIGEKGKILDSLQYLLRKIIGKKYNEKAIISLDAGDFREARTEELKQLGRELADEVKKSGKTRAIPSLNPSERRVVHVVLQDDKDVRSRSVGEGLFKKVLIYRPGTKNRKGPPRKKKGSRNKK